MVTTVLCVAVPPAPVQLTVYVVVLLGETERVPDVAPLVEKLVPVQLVALVEDQVSVEDCQLAMDEGLAVRVAVGTGGADTVTVTELETPLQVAVYVVDVVGETTTDPDVALPVEKLVPVQLAAPDEDQVSVDDCPVVIAVGLAESVADDPPPPSSSPPPGGGSANTGAARSSVASKSPTTCLFIAIRAVLKIRHTLPCRSACHRQRKYWSVL